jgi:hypothetical protein
MTTDPGRQTACMPVVNETTFKGIFTSQMMTGIGSTKVLIGDLESERLRASSGEYVFTLARSREHMERRATL